MRAEFDLDIPSRLEEALAILARERADGATLPIAGGTNLIVDLRAGRVTPARLVSLTRVDGLRGVRLEGETIRMGAGTTIGDMLRDPVLDEHAPSLVDQARRFGGQMVRNTATVAGNICSGSPAADTVPPLLVLDAAVELSSERGIRTVPLSAFFLGYKQLDLAPDELVSAIAWPVPPPGSTNLFYKLARRHGDAITVVGLAVAMTVGDGRCVAARIALGSAAPCAKRATSAEAVLSGKTLTPELIEEAAERAAEACEPIDDLRASAAYRRHGVRVLTRRLLSRAWDHLNAGGTPS